MLLFSCVFFEGGVLMHVCVCASAKQIQHCPKETESTQEPDNSKLFLQLFLRQICVTAQEFCDKQHSRCLCKQHARKVASSTVVYTRWQWEIDKLTKLHLSKSRIHTKLKEFNENEHTTLPPPPKHPSNYELQICYSISLLDHWQLTYKISTGFFKGFSRIQLTYTLKPTPC